MSPSPIFIGLAVVALVLFIVGITYMLKNKEKKWVAYNSLDNAPGENLFFLSGSLETAKQKCLDTPGCTSFFYDTGSGAYGRSSTAVPAKPATNGTLYRLE